MKKTNFYVLKSFVILFALSFVLLGLSSNFNSLSAQVKSPLPKLVQVSEAIAIVTSEMENLTQKSNGNQANLTAGEQARMRMMGVILGELRANRDFVGYQTEYAVHLAATQSTYDQISQTGTNAVALDPFTWISNKYQNDPEYKYIVQKLKF